MRAFKRAARLCHVPKLQGGTAVKKGDLLFQIDPHPLQAALAQAQAALAQDEAYSARLS
ncbi:MAG: biotin/lipoyl-binding protein [Chthoniobacterales bacterium]|nr:biotin/lipoyl-binding protein [Chthoniobacterales bacterium]